jgi:hypothetical protein
MRRHTLGASKRHWIQPCLLYLSKLPFLVLWKRGGAGGKNREKVRSQVERGSHAPFLKKGLIARGGTYTQRAVASRAQPLRDAVEVEHVPAVTPRDAQPVLARGGGVRLDLGLSLTPGCQIAYTDHTGCHQLDVFLTIRPC